jgi:signal transduction histidine kinase
MQLCKIIDSLPDPFVLIDSEFRLIKTNKSVSRIIGRPELHGERCYSLFLHYNEPCNVTVAECPVRTIAETGIPTTTRHYLLTHDGQKKRSLVTAFPVEISDRLIIGLIWKINPNIEHPDTEKMINIYRMAVLGSLISVMVHNINSSLHSVNNYTKLLLKKVEDGASPQDIKGYLEKLDRANRLSADLVRPLLDFARRGTGYTGSFISLKDAVDEVINLFSSIFLIEKIWVNLEIYNEGVCIRRQPLVTVLFSIFQNAIEAMKGGGELTVKIKNREIIIRDTGQGIPEEKLDMILSERAGDMALDGMGLKIARVMMKDLAGRLLLKSKKGEGTEVILRF